MLGAREHDHALHRAILQQLVQQAALVLCRNVIDALLDDLDGHLLR
jgi:hypothetical protein